MKRILFCAVLALAASARGYEIPLATKVPTLDGAFADGEWDEGVCLAGFLHGAQGTFMLPGNEGTATFLADGKTLYVAWCVRAHNVDIGGGMRATAVTRDGAVWDDDASNWSSRRQPDARRISSSTPKIQSSTLFARRRGQGDVK